jgi:branched-chain amino acid transport system ATP-binding protein
VDDHCNKSIPRQAAPKFGGPASLLASDTSSAVSNDFIIETEDLTKEFKGFTAVNNVSLKIRRGTIHALIGPNGAGKTTCFNLLTKFIEPTRGVIRYKGRDITRAKPAEVARMGMVRSFQISATYPHLTLLENVRVALQRPLGTAFHFWKAERSLNVLNDEAMYLLSEVGLADFAAMHATELPYGRKRALEIATTLALDPEMLLLDEPTSGMSHEDVPSITALVARVAAERTVLMVEHNLSVVSDLANTITVLARGEVLAEGSYQQVSKNRNVVDAYMGTGHA